MLGGGTEGYLWLPQIVRNHRQLRFYGDFSERLTLEIVTSYDIAFSLQLRGKIQ